MRMDADASATCQTGAECSTFYGTCYVVCSGADSSLNGEFQEIALINACLSEQAVLLFPPLRSRH